MQGDGESTSCFPGFLSNQPLTDEADGREAILKHPLRGAVALTWPRCQRRRRRLRALENEGGPGAFRASRGCAGGVGSTGRLITLF